MALYDCATIKRIDRSYNKRMIRLDGIIYHIAVSNADYPSYLPGTRAHFYVRKDGTIVQEIDTAFASGANLEGNYYYLSVETEGGVGNDVNNGWTDAQIASLARLGEEATRREGFPVRLMENSFNGERGIGWHRLGIDGNFPATGILRGRQQRGGGRKFSKSRGKLCPTDARIIQMPRILEVIKGAPVKPKPNPVLRLPNAQQREMLEFLGFNNTIEFQRARSLFPDGDMGPITADTLQREYDMIAQQLTNRIQELETTLLRALENATKRPGAPDNVAVETGHNKSKLEKLDLRFMIFETADGRKGVQNVIANTWSFIPSEDTLKRFLDVKMFQGLRYLNAPWGEIRDWSYVRGLDLVTVQDLLAMGAEVPWAYLPVTPEPEVPAEDIGEDGVELIEDEVTAPVKKK